MTQYYRKVVVYFLVLMFTGMIPVAQSDDIDLWSETASHAC